MRGEYVIYDDDGNEIGIVPNTIVGEGQTALMDALFNSDDITDVNFIFGAFSEVPVYATVNATPFTTEPVGNGYSRVTHAPSSWTIVSQNEEVYAQSPTVVFTASGGNFNLSFNRFFMITHIEKPSTVHNYYLTSFSSALAVAVTVANGQSYNLAYRVFMK